jgi:SOS response regulatory protein OraA/RecX
LYRFLYGRGFNSDVIRQVLDQICWSMAPQTRY